MQQRAPRLVQRVWIWVVIMPLSALGPSMKLRAQHVADNAVVSADDAFGATLGLETTGIYDPGNVRGFSPQAAGNTRIEGLYFDQQGSLSSCRLSEGMDPGFLKSMPPRSPAARDMFSVL